MQIDLLIGELLLRNNCVVVPKFGGFIATQTSASIDYASGKMLPPKKSVLFNKQLTNNDGLLLSNYASKFNCSYEEAVVEVETQVNAWFEILNSGKRISIDKVGFIYLDNEKNIRFEQDRFFNLLLQSFGMSQVQFFAEEIEVKEEKRIQPIFTIEKEEIETPVLTIIPEIKLPKKEKQEAKVIALAPKSNKKLLRYVAAACILPIAFYSFWIPTKTDVLESGMFSVQDFNPLHKQVAETYNKSKFQTVFTPIPKTQTLDEMTSKLPEDVTIFPMELDDEIFYVKIKEEKVMQASEIVEQVESSPMEVPTIENTNASSKSGKFKVIVGSFSNDGNANELMNELKAKGFSAFTYPESNGLIRVVAGSSNSNSEAALLVSKLNDLQISSWILK